MHINEDIFLGECKNYKENLGVSWVGKFYGLLKSCKCNFGILFTTNGLTGDKDSWKDAYGLIRVFNLIEQLRRDNDEFYIIVFDMEDYKQIPNKTFFEIVKAKKDAIKIGSKYEKIIEQYKENRNIEVEDVVNELRRK
ncbi:hypothetical protein SAMN02745135_01501 [Caloranaerobacter azorensis DSM 13643]|uniref:Restriction endonuclease n=1 Tax=Caloranaerobacter azorensis DSM 13643 TaxID=1121264 RepID=A0A1M5UN38_9FIRM|nr:hypothetical protein SAMN02745135_01501 [Caloranaerobacter azorensis DSM 13643]